MEQNVEISALRSEKLQQAQLFFSRLGSRDLKFIGVAGSVSYGPSSAEDDVDIFIIAERGKLWKVLLKAFLARRLLGNKDICISLTMDEVYAEDLYRRDAEYVVASDAVHVIPLFGSEYYDMLLSISPFVERYFPARLRKGDSVPDSRPPSVPSLLDYIIFLVLGPYLIMRSLKNNKGLMKTNIEKCFRVRTGFRHFYLDSVKYANLKKKGDDF
ncbi:MAG: hypothetical protein M1129_04205 [Candidatus Thermoplasmatota archaeon]|nr:hypothetical protein [Candidatus Thermoplasmatota archaeon]